MPHRVPSDRTRLSLLVLILFVGSLGLAGCSTDSTREESVDLDRQKLSIFGRIPHVVQSEDNPVTPKKVKLGRILWYEKRMSEDAEFPQLEEQGA